MCFEFLERFLPSVLGSIVGAFCGVVVGFYLDYRHERNKEKTLKDEYRKDFNKEIQQCIELLKRGRGDLLPDDIWKSALSSGHLSLFSEDERDDLRQAYFDVSKTNYSSGISRDRGEQVRAAEDLQKAWVTASAETKLLSDRALSSLQSIMRKSWLKTDT
jgi:hypothetical protein